MNAIGLNNSTPLHDAAQNGHKDIVQVVLQLIIYSCTVDISQLLMANGADPSIANSEGETARDVASSAGIIKLLEKPKRDAHTTPSRQAVGLISALS